MGKKHWIMCAFYALLLYMNYFLESISGSKERILAVAWLTLKRNLAQLEGKVYWRLSAVVVIYFNSVLYKRLAQIMEYIYIYI